MSENHIKYENVTYDRIKAAEYAHKWAYKRNPQFYDFSQIGGDCTNFVSQCLYAGCPYMNFNKDVGWYYISSSNRAAAWSGVEYFYKFVVNNKEAGIYGRLCESKELSVGDVIQLANSKYNYYHTLFVCGFSPNEILVAAHSYNAFMLPLSSYHYNNLRCIKILGGRKQQENPAY